MNKTFSKAMKWVTAVASFAIVAVMLTGCFLGWFGKKESPAVSDNSGMVVGVEDQASPMSLSVKQIAREEYDDYGIMSIAESAYKVTASVKDEGGATPDYLQKVKWAMAWKSTNSAAVTTYVTMTEDGASATFTCLKAFSTQIVVTCTSTLDASKSATVTLDYAKRLTGVKVQFLDGAEQTVEKSGTTVTVTLPAEYAVGGGVKTGSPWTSQSLNWYKSFVFGTEGTVDNSASVDMTITPSSALKAAYNAYKSTSVSAGLKDTVTAVTDIRTLNNFYVALSGAGSTEALSGMGIYHALSTAFFNTTSAAQFTVKLTVTPRYGNVETYTYSLKVLMDKAPVKSLTVDHSSFVF